MPQNFRLDRILVNLGLLSEDQVLQALDRQRAQGGKFGAHLLALGFISEEDLVLALATQHDCPGVILEGVDFPEHLSELITHRIALSRQLIPYEIDHETKAIKIAAANPQHPGLLDELAFLLNGWKIELAVASETSILDAIEDNYPTLDITDTQPPTSALGKNIDQPFSNSFATLFSSADSAASLQISHVVFVCRSRRAARKALRGIIPDKTELHLTEKPDEALDQLLTHFVERIFIQEHFAQTPSERRDFESRVRAINFRVEVIWFGDLSSLALSLAEPINDDSLSIIELLVSLLHASRGETDSRPFRIARYTRKICDHLGLRLRDRKKIVMASLFHHLARYSGDCPDENASRELLMHRTADLLESIGLDDELISILRETYSDSTLNEHTLSLGNLGGAILTVVDRFCSDTSLQEPITLMQFEGLKRRLFEDCDSSTPVEVVEALIHSLQEECLNQRLYEPRGEAVVFSDTDSSLDPFLLYHLTNMGIRVTIANSSSDLIQVCERRRPDVILLVTKAKEKKLLELVNSLITHGVSFTQSPGLLLCPSTSDAPLKSLSELGIHDAISSQIGAELLGSKILSFLDRLTRAKNIHRDGEKVAHGSLTEINLVDLLQALGPGRKTIKIALNHDELQLNVYLLDGQIVYADLGDITGEAAIYRGLGWQTGFFTIRKTKCADIPEHNVFQSNEFIMMEGCRLLDESERSDTSQRIDKFEE